MEDHITVKARKAVDQIWKKCQSKGRTWGIKNNKNPYSKTNITMVNENNVIVLCEGRNGKIRIHEFCKAVGGTDLGLEIRLALKENNIETEEGYASMKEVI